MEVPAMEEDPVPDLPPTILEVVGREEWGAVPPNGKTYDMKLAWPHVLWTYTNSEPCYSKEECCKAMRELQRWHMEERGLPDIPYNFYIGGDNQVYEGRGWHTYPTVVYPGYSDVEKMCVALAYIGKYENQNYPNQEVLEIRKKIVNYGMEKELIDFEYCNLLLTTNLNQ